MKLITEKQLAKEVERPLVKPEKTDSIQKFVPLTFDDLLHRRRAKRPVEPVRLLVTKFVPETFIN